MDVIAYIYSMLCVNVLLPSTKMLLSSNVFATLICFRCIFLINSEAGTKVGSRADGKKAGSGNEFACYDFIYASARL